MDFIAGAKILAERFGETEPVGVERAGDARPLFQWCGGHPLPPGLADATAELPLKDDPK